MAKKKTTAKENKSRAFEICLRNTLNAINRSKEGNITDCFIQTSVDIDGKFVEAPLDKLLDTIRDCGYEVAKDETIDAYYARW